MYLVVYDAWRLAGAEASLVFTPRIGYPSSTFLVLNVDTSESRDL
jgi:hypothetical protein